MHNSLLTFVHLLQVEIKRFGICCVNIIKINFTFFFFTSFNVAAGKFKVTYVACFRFLLYSTALIRWPYSVSSKIDLKKSPFWLHL